MRRPTGAWYLKLWISSHSRSAGSAFSASGAEAFSSASSISPSLH
jgi:hypothetical protein